jgi:hypothetical protein
LLAAAGARDPPKDLTVRHGWLVAVSQDPE